MKLNKSDFDNYKDALNAVIRDILARLEALEKGGSGGGGGGGGDDPSLYYTLFTVYTTQSTATPSPTTPVGGHYNKDTDTLDALPVSPTNS